MQSMQLGSINDFFLLVFLKVWYIINMHSKNIVLKTVIVRRGSFPQTLVWIPSGLCFGKIVKPSCLRDRKGKPQNKTRSYHMMPYHKAPMSLSFILMDLQFTTKNNGKGRRERGKVPLYSPIYPHFLG